MRHFTLVEGHLILLRNAYWEHSPNSECGAPAINPKRPFGNSSAEEDMIELLYPGATICPSCGEHIITLEQREHARRLYEQLPVALEVILTARSFVLGYYVADEHKRNWYLNSRAGK